MHTLVIGPLLTV